LSSHGGDFLKNVVIVGAGLAGCVVAKQLADNGIPVTIIEKSHQIGGKVRTYGCKATDKCQNCGVCLTGGLWSYVSGHPEIDIMLESEIEDITGETDNFSVWVKPVIRSQSIKSAQSKKSAQLTESDPGKNKLLESVSSIVICTGFKKTSRTFSSHLHIEGTTGLLTGTQIEEIMLNRTKTDLFEKTPESIAFIQCTGSRDQNEGGLYCSKVCCSYSTRAAKVILEYYPECKITFFYMELQNVESGNFYKGLQELGISFIKCRPLRITGGSPVMIEYDDPSEGIKSESFDLAVLSEGIHANDENNRLAEMFNLNINKDGFLITPNPGNGIYTAGCAKEIMKIDETCSDAITIAQNIIMNR